MTTVDLSPEDLSGLIGLVYDSAFEEVQWKSFLRRMCQMFPGIGAVAWGYEGDYMFPEYARGGEEAIFPEVALMEMRTLTNQTTSEITKENDCPLSGKTVSLPVVTCGITHGIATFADVWINPEDVIIVAGSTFVVSEVI